MCNSGVYLFVPYLLSYLLCAGKKIDNFVLNATVVRCWGKVLRVAKFVSRSLLRDGIEIKRFVLSFRERVRITHPDSLL